MKAAVGTSLSLVGVIVAGSAAAMVNAQVLRGGDSAGGGSVPALAASAPPTTLEATTTSVASTHVVYRVGDSGVVTVDAAGGALALVSVVPSPGWEVLASGVGPTGELEVRFSSWGVEVRLTATLVDGAIVPMVSSGVLEVISDDDADGGDHVTAPSPAPAPVTPPPPPPSSAQVDHDDEHEDEHEDDEHEEEHEDEHEDGHGDDD